MVIVGEVIVIVGEVIVIAIVGEVIVIGCLNFLSNSNRLFKYMM